MIPPRLLDYNEQMIICFLTLNEFLRRFDSFNGVLLARVEAYVNVFMKIEAISYENLEKLTKTIAMP